MIFLTIGTIVMLAGALWFVTQLRKIHVKQQEEIVEEEAQDEGLKEEKSRTEELSNDESEA